MPSVAVAGRGGLYGGSAIIDSKMQGYRAVATSGIGGLICRGVSRGRIGGTVPSISVASSNGFNACSAAIDGQMQGDSAVAA